MHRTCTTPIKSKFRFPGHKGIHKGIIQASSRQVTTLVCMFVRMQYTGGTSKPILLLVHASGPSTQHRNPTRQYLGQRDNVNVIMILTRTMSETKTVKFDTNGDFLL